jgi:hypothetical protein
MLVCVCGAAQAVTYTLEGSFGGQSTHSSSFWPPYTTTYSGMYESGPASHGTHFRYAPSEIDLSVSTSGRGYVSSSGAGHNFTLSSTSSSHSSSGALVVHEDQTVRIRASISITRSPNNTISGTTEGSISLGATSQSILHLSGSTAGEYVFDQVVSLTAGSYLFAMAYDARAGGSNTPNFFFDSNVGIDMKITPVPEPTSMLILGAGLAALIKRNKKGGAR